MTPGTFFKLMQAFTEDAYEVMGVPFEGTGKNHYGKYRKGQPSGHVMHYTASPDAKGRLKSMMKRFQRNSRARVGIAFMIFDKLDPRLAKVRAKYPELYGPNGVFKVDVLHMGLDLAFWSSNWANRFTCATELRNVGKLYTKNGKTFYWGRPKNIGVRKYLYRGRTPVKVRGMWCEPFTDDQILASVKVCRELKRWMGKNFDSLHFMSHHMIHRNKWDAWPHYPFGRVKKAICFGGPLRLGGYLEELNKLSCPPITDWDNSSTDFLTAMGYLTQIAPGWGWKLEAWEQAIKCFQEKKGLRRTGKLTKPTIKAMNGTRRVYRLTGKGYD